MVADRQKAKSDANDEVDLSRYAYEPLHATTLLLIAGLDYDH